MGESQTGYTLAIVGEVEQARRADGVLLFLSDILRVLREGGKRGHY